MLKIHSGLTRKKQLRKNLRDSERWWWVKVQSRKEAETLKLPQKLIPWTILFSWNELVKASRYFVFGATALSKPPTSRNLEHKRPYCRRRTHKQHKMQRPFSHRIYVELPVVVIAGKSFVISIMFSRSFFERLSSMAQIISSPS